MNDTENKDYSVFKACCALQLSHLNGSPLFSKQPNHRASPIRGLWQLRHQCLHPSDNLRRLDGDSAAGGGRLHLALGARLGLLVGARDGKGPVSDGRVRFGARGRDRAFEVGGIT